jgi:hypothetical protein
MTFLTKTSETKKFVKIFLRGVFDFKQIFCLSHPGLIFIFTKKGFLNSQAMRIRVKLGKYRPNLEYFSEKC